MPANHIKASVMEVRNAVGLNQSLSLDNSVLTAPAFFIENIAE